MLIVGRADIETAVDLRSMAVAIEDAFGAASAGEVASPPVGHITFPDVDGECHIKFGHRRGDADFVRRDLQVRVWGRSSDAAARVVSDVNANTHADV